MKRDLQDRVAIVTGAGGGLGRAHALMLAGHGARVVVNDRAAAAAEAVTAEIVASGGQAIAAPASVADTAEVAAMVDDVTAAWGGIDILINNAGILRDKSFAKMDIDDFRLVVDVHLMGAAICSKAVWDQMRARRFGRIVMTTSSSGLYGNFGQANYGAAKMALVGLMQTLALEGERQDIRVNCLAPTAATAMTEGVLPPEALARLQPDYVSPGLVALVGEDAPTRTILLAGAGSFESAHLTMTRGIFIDGSDYTAAEVMARMDEIRDRADERVPGTGFEQYQWELSKAGFEVPLPR